ncbi:MAG: MFS transporter [Candidatus Omnitrophica bacterium]|nr:MFS transporter [Candidatus Omnitrophota bacterium]
MIARYLFGLWIRMSERGRQTLPWDLIRGGADGAASSFGSTFALLVAINYFNCTPLQKSLIAAGSSLGLGLSVFYATYAHALIGRRSLEAAFPMFLAAMAIGWGALTDDPTTYAAAATLGPMLLGMRVPLLTAIYRENYRDAVRGQVYGLTLVVSALGGVAFTSLGGRFLNGGIERFPWVICFTVLFTIAGAMATLQIPSERGPRKPLPNPFAYFKVLRENSTFVAVLISWFLFGLANLAMVPQRFEYVSQERYGFSLSPGMTALLIGVVPEVTRVLAVLPMGRLFDRMNFITLRLLINLFLAGFQIFFFTAHSIPMLVFASVLLGIGNAGGSVAWSLWVTRYSSPADTTKYMAMHTFFTGVRGIVGPYAGYWIAERESVQTASWIATGLILASCLFLIWVEWGRRVGPTEAKDLEGPSE